MLGTSFNATWAPTWVVKAEDEFGNLIIRERFVNMTPLPAQSLEPLNLKIPCSSEKEAKQYQDKLDEVHYVYLYFQYRYGWSIKTVEKWHLKSTNIDNVAIEGSGSILSFTMGYNIIDHKVEEKTETAKPTKTNRQKRVERMKRLFLK